jgi:eukaryotic-like serine/threonine-protein kinase
VLGRYRPLRPLGSGGSGSVWLAHDEESDREVALKVVRREGKAGSRAEREVEAAARLRHPRCLRALALDRDEEHVYVAYEYVRGRTFRELMRAGELDDAAAVEAAAQVLEALAHAHAKGIVHRDVKPANVMLEDGPWPSGHDSDVSVRVLDFGLAQVEEADTLTAAGDVPGTLAYIAPERLNGGLATGAADVWAVGVMLWEALAGWHPFSGPSPVETARRIRAGAQPLSRSRPDLPATLCALVDRMLERDPGRRPSAKRLAGTLRLAGDARARRPRAVTSRAALRERAVPAVLAAAFAAGSTLLLPFFPRGWPLLLGVAAGLAALRAPRIGLAVALATLVFPLGNVSLGLALAYGLGALVWLAVFACDARSGLLFLVGSVLAPIGGLAAAPVAVLGSRGIVRRSLLAAAAVLTGAALATALGSPFPVSDGATGTQLHLDGVERLDEAARTLLAALADRPGLALEAIVFALAAAAAPLARRRADLWGVALWASAFLAAAAFVPAAAGAHVSGLLLAPGVWAAAAALALPAVRSQRAPRPPEGG